MTKKQQIIELIARVPQLPIIKILSIVFGLVMIVLLCVGVYIKIFNTEQSAVQTNHLPPAGRAVLHLGMMIHLEGWFDEVDNEAAFNEHVTATRALAQTLEDYGAKGTFEAGPEFIRGIANWDDNVIAELEAAGHGVGVHADVGGMAERDGLDQRGMMNEIKQMKFEFEKTTGVEARHVSGICSTLDWVEAAIQAGYEFTTGAVAYCVMSMPEQERLEEFRNCLNPGVCHDVFPVDVEDRISPWRVSSGDDWLEHEPDGNLVFLASDDLLYNYSKEIEITGNKELMTEDDVEGFIVALEESLAAVESDQINMMYVSWSIGDAGRAQDPNIEVWLQAVEPYVEAGLVEWATLPEIYDQYLDWEQGITDYSDDEPVVSGDELVQVYEDIEYAEVDGISLELDLYRPAGVDGDLPLIIWIHGGGWLSGDKSDVDEMCKRLVMDDFAVASLDFRLSGDALWPAQIHDVKAAVRWLRAHADNYDLDPDSFGVIGSSSGGHLASLLGVTGGVEALEGVVGNYDHVSSQVSAVVDMFGPVNLHRLSDDCAGQCVMDHSAADSPESSLLGCALSECLDQAELASVSTYVTADDPPFLIIHGDQDSTIPIAQSMNLVSDLEDAGVEAEFIKATDFAHSRTMFWEYDEQIVRFLNQKLK